ncbi:MAG: hypothetical protein KKB62_02350 [Nanoarchaeota archaeon]|nr:hypothetical protein [Nanoarchaeota archaeon]
MKKIALPLTALMFLFSTNSTFDNGFKKERSQPDITSPAQKIYFDENLGSYISEFSFSGNFRLEKGKELSFKMPPRAILNLDNSLLDLSADSLKSVTYPSSDPTIFSKTAYILNDSDHESRVKIEYDSSSVLNFSTDGISKIRNGPFMAFEENGILNVRSFYGPQNVIPMKVFLESGEKINDSLEFFDEKFYSPYFVSSRLAEKDSLTGEDMKWILDSYENLYGDYFKVNYKALVCTDAATLITKTAGIDLESELNKHKIYGNEYRQKNVATMKRYASKINPENINLFKGGDLEKILKYGNYSDLTPENFGMENFSPGQVLLFTRFYNTGPKKGKIQREDIHFGVIYDVGEGGNKITLSSMVSSRTSKPPYGNLIQLTTVDFEEWYKARSNYTGSDETTESLTYRVYGIIDWLDVINQVKKESKQKPFFQED